MSSIIAFVGALLSAGTAFGLEVFTVATMNPYADTLEQKDYGSSRRTGGSIVAVGVFSPSAQVLGIPLELRLQRARQSTAWNDNRKPGETPYRDGYQIEATEALLGYRWAFHPRLSTSIQLGGGRSKIEYRTRENHGGGSTHKRAARAQHLTSQVDLRYILPLDSETVEVGLAGMLRLSVPLSHAASDQVARTTWYVNVPYFPVPSLGLAFGVKL